MSEEPSEEELETPAESRETPTSRRVRKPMQMRTSRSRRTSRRMPNRRPRTTRRTSRRMPNRRPRTTRRARTLRSRPTVKGRRRRSRTGTGRSGVSRPGRRRWRDLDAAGRPGDAVGGSHRGDGASVRRRLAVCLRWDGDRSAVCLAGDRAHLAQRLPVRDRPGAATTSTTRSSCG